MNHPGSKPIDIPTAGDLDIVHGPDFGKAMATRKFTHPTDPSKSFERLLWHYTKPPPVLVMPVTTEMDIVAVRQFRPGANEVTLELPGGLPKKGQTDSDTAVAELREETGYDAMALVDLGPTLWSDANASTLNIKFFLATGCCKVSGQNLDEDEYVETLSVPISEWYAMVCRGEMRDMKTVAHSMLALPHLMRLGFTL